MVAQHTNAHPHARTHMHTRTFTHTHTHTHTKTHTTVAHSWCLCRLWTACFCHDGRARCICTQRAKKSPFQEHSGLLTPLIPYILQLGSKHGWAIWKTCPLCRWESVNVHARVTWSLYLVAQQKKNTIVHLENLYAQRRQRWERAWLYWLWSTVFLSIAAVSNASEHWMATYLFVSSCYWCK